MFLFIIPSSVSALIYCFILHKKALGRYGCLASVLNFVVALTLRIVNLPLIVYLVYKIT